MFFERGFISIFAGVCLLMFVSDVAAQIKIKGLYCKNYCVVCHLCLWNHIQYGRRNRYSKWCAKKSC